VLLYKKSTKSFYTPNRRMYENMTRLFSAVLAE